MGRISTSCRYEIDITVLDPLSFRGVGGISSTLVSSVLLDVLGRYKLVGVLEICANWLNNSLFPGSTIWRGLEGGDIVKIEVCLSYEWEIGS